MFRRFTRKPTSEFMAVDTQTGKVINLTELGYAPVTPEAIEQGVKNYAEFRSKQREFLTAQNAT